MLTQFEGKHVEKLHADRSVNPSAQDIYYLFRTWREEQYGKESGEEMFAKLEAIVGQYNEKHSSEGGYAYLQRYISKDSVKCSQPLVLAVCTPLMARVHKLIRQAGELTYCDSTASLDRYNCPTFILSTSCSAGGVPLGVVITSGENEPTITEALTFLKGVLPSYAFYGRNNQGPEICITDDSSAERAALKTVWPNTTYLLCIFHYLQSWWSWLLESKQGISKEDRQPIFNLVRRLVYVRSEASLHAWYAAILESTYATKYPHLVKHIQQLWKRRSEWALSYRVKEITRGNHTNNYAEGGIRIIKEMVFDRVKAYNLIQMFEFIAITMEQYFCNRLLDLAHSRYRPGIAIKYKDLYSSLDTITCTEQLFQYMYLVTEKTKTEELKFYVDMELGVCSCIKGYAGAACKHQAAVAKNFSIPAVNIPPFHAKEARRLYATLARGQSKEMKFYNDLREASSEEDIQNDSDNFDDYDEANDYFSTSHSEIKFNNSSSDSAQLTNEETKVIEEDLHNIVNDITERLNDQNMISGVKKFIKSYTRMQHSSFAPTATISYALHNFGKPDSKLH